MTKHRKQRPAAKPARAAFSSPADQATLLAMIHDGLVADQDETVTGVTLITPDGNFRYISKAQAKAHARGRQ
jgi:hypothetical protein